jgi:hypothetical protein
MLIAVVSLVFLLLLCFTHLEGDAAELLAQPMSMFRDGEAYVHGYVLFLLLLLLGALQTTAMLRARRNVEAAFVCVALGLLTISLATPTGAPVHELTSFLLMFLLFTYYGCLLFQAGSIWLLPHLFLPFWLMGLTGLHSFGLWEKCAIAYFVLACNVQAYFLKRETPEKTGRRPRPLALRRRKVFVVEPMRAWVRRP